MTNKDSITSVKALINANKPIQGLLLETRIPSRRVVSTRDQYANRVKKETVANIKRQNVEEVGCFICWDCKTLYKSFQKHPHLGIASGAKQTHTKNFVCNSK